MAGHPASVRSVTADAVLNDTGSIRCHNCDRSRDTRALTVPGW
jgi:hypothetical protein